MPHVWEKGRERERREGGKKGGERGREGRREGKRNTPDDREKRQVKTGDQRRQ